MTIALSLVINSDLLASPRNLKRLSCLDEPRFPTSLEDDEQLLGEKLATDMELAVRFRAGKKRCLAATLQGMKAKARGA